MSAAADLAALAAVDRERIPDLAALIPVEPPAPVATLFELADAYVQARATRAWAVVVAIATAYCLVYAQLPDSFVRDLILPIRSGWALMMTILAVASLAAHLVRRRAERRFAAAMAASAAPLETAARLARGNAVALDALVIASVASFVTFFTMMIAFGLREFEYPAYFDPWGGGLFAFTNWSVSYWNGKELFHDLTLAIVLVTALSLAIAWLSHRKPHAPAWSVALARLRWPLTIVTIVTFCGIVALWANAQWWMHGAALHFTADERTAITLALGTLSTSSTWRYLSSRNH